MPDSSRTLRRASTVSIRRPYPLAACWPLRDAPHLCRRAARDTVSTREDRKSVRIRRGRATV